jgi:hypothetical protein
MVSLQIKQKVLNFRKFCTPKSWYVTYFHSTDPLDADDWLKTITKKLERAQCIDREMVLYASGCLEGLASDW